MLATLFIGNQLYFFTALPPPLTPQKVPLHPYYLYYFTPYSFTTH